VSGPRAGPPVNDPARRQSSSSISIRIAEIAIVPNPRTIQCEPGRGWRAKLARARLQPAPSCAPPPRHPPAQSTIWLNPARPPGPPRAARWPGPAAAAPARGGCGCTRLRAAAVPARPRGECLIATALLPAAAAAARSSGSPAFLAAGGWRSVLQRFACREVPSMEQSHSTRRSGRHDDGIGESTIKWNS
jgi:hypothetical protein